MKKTVKPIDRQVSSAYELFYRLLFDCDPSRAREERAHYLLQVLHQLDVMGDKIPRREFSDIVSKAIVACGFENELEAWEALTQLVDPAILMEPGRFLETTLPADKSGPN